MRLAVFHNQPSGGARRALAGFCDQLRRSNEIDVYSLTTADDEWLPDARLGWPMPREEYSPRRQQRGGLWLNDVRRARDADDLEAANVRAASVIDAGGYDVVLVDACQFSLVPSVLVHLETPAAYYAHNGPASAEGSTWSPTRSTYATMRDAWHGPLVRQLERRRADAQRAAIAAATLVVANSHHTAGRVLTAWGRDALVCPPGVDIPGPAPHDGTGVLSVGELEPRKGFDFVVRGIALLPPTVRPRLRICANRADVRTRRRLEELARELDVRLRIDINPPQAELWRAYEAASVFVYGAHHEALGLAPLEAMARARPVVAVAEGGVVETVRHGHTGLLTDRNVAHFAAALGSLLDDPDRRRRLGRQARAQVKRSWTWTARAGALEDALAGIARCSTRCVR